MKSIKLELIPIDPGLDQLLMDIKSAYQIVPDQTIIGRIKRDSIASVADGREYTVFDNQQWLITGKIDDEEPDSIWIEVFKK
jgi:hypothetical protein